MAASAHSAFGNPINPPEDAKRPATGLGAAQPKWALILRGVSGLLFGLAAFALPGVTFLMLVAMFAAYMLIDGVFAISSGLKAGRVGERWWPYVLEGVANLAVGAIALVWPGATALVLVYMVAFWSIFTGVLLMFPNPRLGIGSRILLALAGLASILLGAAMVLQPIAGSLAVVWLTGTYGLVFGSLMLAAGLRMRPASKAATLS